MASKKGDYANYSMGKILWELIRPHTLTATFVPVIIGTILALSDKEFHVLLFVTMLLACLLIQMATNMFNEYYDFKRGLDTEESVGIGGAIVRHGFQPKSVLQLALAAYAVAMLLGIYICAATSWWLALIGLIGMAVGYLYTGGPIPIAYTPLGELMAGLCMGAPFVILSYYIQTGTVTLDTVFIAIPVAILTGCINMSNNMRDIEEDKVAGRKTLAVLLGSKNIVYVFSVFLMFSYLWIIGLIIFAGMTPWLLLVFLSIPKPIKAIKGFVGERTPIQMVPAMIATAQTNTIFGLLLSVGLFISILL